jgi:hypothetical protein
MSIHQWYSEWSLPGCCFGGERGAGVADEGGALHLQLSVSPSHATSLAGLTNFKRGFRPWSHFHLSFRRLRRMRENRDCTVQPHGNKATPGSIVLTSPDAQHQHCAKPYSRNHSLPFLPPSLVAKLCTWTAFSVLLTATTSCTDWSQHFSALA